MRSPNIIERSSSQRTDQLFGELRTLIGDLGKDGGIISASVYDTAQVLRFHPPQEGVEPALEWLLSQQQADGGWGDPSVPIARDVPTLAAILAIDCMAKWYGRSSDTIDAGLAFLHGNSGQWVDADIGLFPVGVELVLPRLIEEARRTELDISFEPYKRLLSLRKHRLSRIGSRSLGAGSAPSHSAEGFAAQQIIQEVGHSGGIGHSPAATAFWLGTALKSTNGQEQSEGLSKYLNQAGNATGIEIPGVVPTVWPLNGFEETYGLYALYIAGLLQHPFLADAVRTIAGRVNRSIEGRSGVGLSPSFSLDVDCTATGITVVSAMGYDVNSEALIQFRSGDHFYTYPDELNPSILSNAHALSALSLMGLEPWGIADYLVDRQHSGRWMPDKWHTSWRYATTEVVHSLNILSERDSCYRYCEAVDRAMDGLIHDQREDGGWGMVMSTPAETAFVVLALKRTAQRNTVRTDYLDALKRGTNWLKMNYAAGFKDQDAFWLGKELYSAYRVNRVYVLSAILASTVGGK
jgi:hypothetical protein